MNAHIPGQKKKKSRAEERKIASVRQWIKIVCVALNRTYGFGAKRLERVITEIVKIFREKESDPVFGTIWIKLSMMKSD